MTALGAALETAASAVENALDALLASAPGEPAARLRRAMRHACLGGGKRLRPFLALQAAALFGAGGAGPLRAAAAVELVHCYALAHDDLPAMDDDERRRGRPATHIAFGEATAILAGDALLALAFETLAAPETHPDPGVRAALVSALARAAGAGGMAGGQAMDIEAEGRAPDRNEVVLMQRMKTGALIGAACESGALIAGAGEGDRAALRAYAGAFGLAFQIADDLLDATGDSRKAGKALRKDARAGKATFVALFGAEAARARAEALAEEAVAALARFGSRADLLRAAARFAVARRR